MDIIFQKKRINLNKLLRFSTEGMANDNLQLLVQ